MNNSHVSTSGAQYIVEVRTDLIVDNESDSIKAQYPADYSYSSDRQVIEYTEVSDDSFSQAVSLVIDSDGMVINRANGAFVLDLRRKTGELLYSSPAGQIPLSYITKYFRADLTESGGIILASYTLDIGGVASENALRITIRCAD